MTEKKSDVPVGTPEVSFEKQRKDTIFNQLCKVQLAFFLTPKTMMEIDQQTGIRRENICRYVKIMREAGAIWLVKKGTCSVTKENGVGFYSTNPQFAENLPKQLKLNLFA